jgi:ubiquinone/menaquinone biosynthesis C-methylase UbiE
MNENPDEMERILEETKEYYRRRASQYSDWSQRTGEYEGGSEPEASFFDEAKILLDALYAARLAGNVLEIASGTGIWTEALSKNATTVTALDSSQEMIERCKSRLRGNPKVRYVLADFYDWTPDRAYDAVSFSFWISHVPASKLEEFVSKLSHCLRPGGRVFFVDQQRDAIKNEILEQPGGEVASRTLDDGRRFSVIKHFYSPEEIQEAFLKHGIETRITNTPIQFFYAEGEKIR